MDYFDIYDLNRYDTNQAYGVNITPTFHELFQDDAAFLAEYKNGMFPTEISDASCRTVYYLLYARYGNDEIADNIDVNQWKAHLMSLIFQHGPAWEKRLEVQKKVRGWNEEQILEGAEDVYNTAAHPGKAVPEGGIVKAINQQNVNYRKKDKMSAYSYLLSLLETDITEEFLLHFKPLFNPYSGIKSRVKYYEVEADL